MKILRKCLVLKLLISITFFEFVNTLAINASSKLQTASLKRDGDLLIGREDKLTASSTCGLTKTSDYCLTNLECFKCRSMNDSRHLSSAYHRIENVVDGESTKDFWWQSENNVKEVTIQADFENTFYLTNLTIEFKHEYPSAIKLEKSYNNGFEYRILKYFAKNCSKSFPGVKLAPRTDEDDNVCEDYKSNEKKIFYEVIPYHLQGLLAGRIMKKEYLRQFTNLKITMYHDDEYFGNNFFAITKIKAMGSCQCFGVSSECVPNDDQLNKVNPNVVYGKCKCAQRVLGLRCTYCEKGQILTDKGCVDQTPKQKHSALLAFIKQQLGEYIVWKY
ncbi:laminin beta 1 chain-like protein [Leptotrombidium deliense]|uniref:Laminin beta 1 chain-like protein n=1 Tax=Leptotrombidium deliense TaxID=299467 RepID=A0A443SAA1_9ACAR|nr:laminin beta 1 chain-like protein [Leptotrombidium deliense]